MKALIKNEEAQAGVGTLIIFIAMVLVAAVAAAVLIQTSGTMQAKSTQTAKQAGESIGENILIESVNGISNGSSVLTAINITVKVASGGSDIDLSKLLVKVKAQNYNYTMTGNGTYPFRVYTLRDPDNGTGAPINSYTSAANPILKPGALARVDIVVTDLTDLKSGKPMSIALTPEKGATFNLPITLPAVGDSKTDVAIYP